MSEPSDNGQQPPVVPRVLPTEEPAGWERGLAVLGIVAGIALIIMGLDTMTGGRLLGTVLPEQQE